MPGGYYADIIRFSIPHSYVSILGRFNTEYLTIAVCRSRGSLSVPGFAEGGRKNRLGALF